MTEPTMRLVDIHGPFAGQEREYAKTAGEVALANGYARLPGDPEPVVETSPSLPADFPARDVLAGLGIDTVDSVPKTRRGLEALPGVGRRKATQVLDALGIVE